MEKTNKKESKKAVIYARVAKDDGVASKSHIGTQVLCCKQAIQRAGCELAADGVYTEVGKSGLTIERTELAKMVLRLITGNEVKAVVVSDLARLTRNVHHYMYLKQLFEGYGIGLVIADAGQDYPAEMKLADTVRAAVNQMAEDIEARNK